MPQNDLLREIQGLASQNSWKGERLLALLTRYDVTPEMLLQRFTNLLPHHFGVRDLFFIRLSADAQARNVRMTKELPLSRLHTPFANERDEHYCRRWVSVNVFKELVHAEKQDKAPPWHAGAQISSYWKTENSYFVFSIAQRNPMQGGHLSSMSIGLLINPSLLHWLHFLDDPALPRRTVHTTCERCGIPDCQERAAEPIRLIEEEAAEARRSAIEALRTKPLHEKP